MRYVGGCRFAFYCLLALTLYSQPARAACLCFDTQQLLDFFAGTTNVSCYANTLFARRYTQYDAGIFATYVDSSGDTHTKSTRENMVTFNTSNALPSSCFLRDQNQTTQAVAQPAFSQGGVGALAGYKECWDIVKALCPGGVPDPSLGAILVLDADGDGVPDDEDNCPDAANADQADLDGDGAGDACDVDDDNDGVSDGADNCPVLANADQANFDGDGLGDACDADDDNDGASDDADNCPFAANSDQADFDWDGLGDACDPDQDGDGVDNGLDLCADTDLGSAVNGGGCSLAQLCPCDAFKNHGGFVSCVAHEAGQFASGDGIGGIVSEAAKSGCSKKK